MIGASIKYNKWKKTRAIEEVVSSTSEDTLEFVSLYEFGLKEYDFLVQNGIKNAHNRKNYVFAEKRAHSLNIPILIREAPNIRQLGNGAMTKIPFEHQWIKLTWNSFFMDEGLFPYDSSYDRWSELSKKFDIKVHDWKRRGDAVLFNLQIPTDSALNRLTFNDIDYKDFILEKIKQTQAITDRPIIIRSHPLDTTAREYIEKNIDVEFSQGKTLYEDLNRSWCMVTYNSTSCVESTLYGTPTIVLDPSAVSTEVSQTKLEQIEDSWQPEREEWCKKIAFHQWQGSELTDGYVWTLLKSLVWK